MLFRRTKKSAPSKSIRRFQPLVETLEGRLPLAGNVTASFAGGTLVLTGNNLDNEIRIEGAGAGNFTVTGVATTVNGSANAFVRTGVRNILINMNGGNDTATFVNANLTGLLNFNGGAGHDELLFGEGNNGTQVFTSVTAIMGAGDDTIRTNGEDNFTIRSSFIANNGDGSNTTDFDPIVSLNLGLVSVTGGTGFDFVDLGDGLVNTGSILVSHGSGGSAFYLDGEFGFNVNGSISVFAGNGNDEFNPGDFPPNQAGFNVTGGIVVNLGNGNNTVDFESLDTAIGAGLIVTTGTGNDTVNVDGDTFAAALISLNLGAGNNEVTLDPAVSVGTNSLVITTLGGLDTITALNLTANVVSVSTGEGVDIISVDNSIFLGPVTISTGGGNDAVNVEFLSDDGIGTTFNSVVSVNLGAGNDEILLGLDADDFVTFNNRVTAIGGTGTDDFFGSGFDDFAFAPVLLQFP